MFEYVKDREAEAKRSMTISSVMLAVALIATLIAIAFAIF